MIYLAKLDVSFGHQMRTGCESEANHQFGAVKALAGACSEKGFTEERSDLGEATKKFPKYMLRFFIR